MKASKVFRKIVSKYSRLIFAATFLFICASINTAQTTNELIRNNAPTTTDSSFVLNADRLNSDWEGNLSSAGWLYKTGDNLSWAASDFNDSDWEKLRGTQFYTNNLPENGWMGAAWFRLLLAVDEQVARQPLALRMVGWGAFEIYLDGNLLKRFGKVDGGEEVGNSEIEQNPRGIPVPFTFGSVGEHVIAIRYSFSATKDLSKGFGAWINHGRFNPGFSSAITTTAQAIAANDETIRNFDSNKLFIGILYSFAFLHFLLFIFYRQERANLFYSLFAFSLANATLSNSIYNISSQATFAAALFFIIFAFSYGVAFLFLQAFLYEALARRFSRFFTFTSLLVIAQLIILIIFLRDRITFYITCVLLIILLADCLRLVIKAVWQKREGAWIIAGGVLVLAVGIMMSIAQEFYHFQAQLYSDINNITLYCGLPIAVSIYLARNFARTNRNLELQLGQVKELSEKELEQSRLTAALALEREQEKARFALIEAENQRQAQELEEARQLQLSMLPAKLPNIADLKIAAFMKPATEVGGDYYDFHVADDGTLTVVVGDATGHGLKAGSVVTATKSLFNAFAEQRDIPEIFTQMSGALKKMNLRGLFMAMAMLKIKNGAMTLCVAGMPSILIYRAASKTIEEISLRAMPLGSITKTHYQEHEMSLLTGDCVVLMSDGFPEMFNPENEMLGFEKAAEILPNIAELSPQEIVNHLLKAGDEWANGRPQDDDVTFVVLKIG